MWFIVPVAFLLLAVLIGSAFAGGIYTLVLVPIVVIVAVVVGVSVMLRRSRGQHARELGHAGWAPTPGGGSEGEAAAGGANEGRAATGDPE